MRRMLLATAAIALFVTQTACSGEPTQPTRVQAVRAEESGPGFGSGHFTSPPTQTTTGSFETVAASDSATRSGPGFGSGH
jgi:hypothetical protein